MPPKTSSSATAKSNKSNKEASEAINTYFSQKPDFERLIKEAKENPSRPPPGTRQTEYNQKVKEAVKEVLEERRVQAEQKNRASEMPHHPKDENPESSKNTIVVRMVVIANRRVFKDPSEKGSQQTEPSNPKKLATMDHHVRVLSINLL